MHSHLVLEHLIKKVISLLQPVSWQPGITNPYCGTHVWNEPDPVKIISTLYKVNRLLLGLVPTSGITIVIIIIIINIIIIITLL